MTRFDKIFFGVFGVILVISLIGLVADRMRLRECERAGGVLVIVVGRSDRTCVDAQVMSVALSFGLGPARVTGSGETKP